MFAALLDTDDAPIGQIPVDSVSDTAEGTASAAIEFEADGDVFTHTLSGGTTHVGTWLIPTALTSLCTIRADIVSGLLDGGSSAPGTDLAMTTDRQWGISIPGAGSRSTVLTITIKFHGVPIASRNVTLDATAAAES